MEKRIIKPQGWLLEYIDTQMKGLTGHIEEAGFPYDRKFWGEEKLEAYKGIFWWPFEQTAYYIDGYVRTAILLGAPEMINKAEKMIYPVLEKADDDGYIGPKELIRHYLGKPVDHSEIRNVFNVEIMLELYRANGNKALLDMAVKTYEKGKDNFVENSIKKVASKAPFHGVTYNEYAKLGALLYRETGEKKYLETSVKAYKKIERYYMLPGGCNSSSEYMLNNRYDEVYETCDIADMTWALHYLAEVCDDVKYSDMIEKCVFNAGIGSVTEDFRALQYFSCANQVILDEKSSTCRFDRGGKSMSYSPMPFTACCPGNVNRIMSNYVLSMWDIKDSTVTARMYGPSQFSGEINGKSFTITEKTKYPFDLNIEFEIKTEVPFTLRLRIPKWSKNFECDFKTFEISADTVVRIAFEADIVQKENHGGVYFERGPLVYSLGMKGERSVYETKKNYPSYRMYADKKWNYAVIGDGAPEFCEGKDEKWTLDANLPSITVTCREVENWKIRHVKKVNAINWKYEPIVKEFEEPRDFTPLFPRKGQRKLTGEENRITLYPYGASKIRMTVLPKEEK